jgi:hypothetical protein
VSTTQRHYTKLTASAEGVAAMKKLGRLVGQEWGKSKSRKSKKSRKGA